MTYAVLIMEHGSYYVDSYREVSCLLSPYWLIDWLTDTASTAAADVQGGDTVSSESADDTTWPFLLAVIQ